MSNKIDWSNAPEGATHYSSERVWPWLRDGDMPAYFDGSKWVDYHNESTGRSHIAESVRIPTNVEWNGVGPVGVGTVCEAWHKGSPQGIVEVRYAGDFMVLWNVKLKHEQCSAAEDYEFRVIRTPEQIKAEERSRECDRIYEILSRVERPDNKSDMAEALYDAGYRKVEID